ncbi:MAG: sugar-transfer associated ATP-grasp domain-containing protein [Patescibacteria group bacterium]
MNARNLEYIRHFNRKRAKRLCDDKLATKRLLRRHNIPTPKLYGVISSPQDLKQFEWGRLPESFVLKPNMGGGGEGIKVIFGRRKDGQWVSARGRRLNFYELVAHILNIMDGNYSLTNVPDSAFFEERIRILKEMKPYSFEGIPDIRVIVFNHIPVMAMLRLPTKESEGKANLHLGGIGAGVDIATGVTTTAVYRDGVIDTIPGTQIHLSGFKIPHWNDILEIAVETQRISNVGYLGVDIAIDKELGPVVLELNARPGLAIQIANRAPLRERLERVAGIHVKTTRRGIRIAKEIFGGEIEQEVEEITGRQVVGVTETVKLMGRGQQEIEVEARVDTGAGRTSLTRELAIQLGFEDAIRHYDSFGIPDPLKRAELDQLSEGKMWKRLREHPDIVGVDKTMSAHGGSYRMLVPITFYLAGRKVVTKASIYDRQDMVHPILIGRRDLKWFLVDPAKERKISK